MKKIIGILLYDGFTALDAIGPYQVLNGLNDYSTIFIAKNKGILKDNCSLNINIDYSIKDIDCLDILIIPGGLKQTYEIAIKDNELLDWIRKIDKTTSYTMSICTGAWIIAAAGLLTNKKATTHWYGKDILKSFNVNVVNKRWINDGKYWSSAGVTAGMDMCLDFLIHLKGIDYAKNTMLDLEYDPAPPIDGGSAEKTDQITLEKIKESYDKLMK